MIRNQADIKTDPPCFTVFPANDTQYSCKYKVALVFAIFLYRNYEHQQNSFPQLSSVTPKFTVSLHALM